MNKSDLATQLATQLTQLPRHEVDFIVDIIFDRMAESLSRGERIEIRGFGSFEIRTRPSREGRNPKTGEKVFVETRRVPFFKVGKELKELINDGEEAEALPQARVSGE